jgi:hypothetical protein
MGHRDGSVNQAGTMSSIEVAAGQVVTAAFTIK